ncbi:MAG: hypothetical protein Q4A05_02720 [Ruminococcus sp.]|nr:hypothetical protein [Ruminococcus sp.]
MIIKLWKSKKNAEKRLGVKFNRQYTAEVLDLCKKKLQIIGKNDDYLPILYESELVMKFYGRMITETSAENEKTRKEAEPDVFRMQKNLLSSVMSECSRA